MKLKDLLETMSTGNEYIRISEEHVNRFISFVHERTDVFEGYTEDVNGNEDVQKFVGNEVTKVSSYIRLGTGTLGRESCIWIVVESKEG